MIINHNLGAMNANRNMGINQASASKSMQKLSSGLRINSAADDAAGLAISEKMRGQIRGLDQASANAQDGISMIQTGEGALNETHSILQRMRELAVQSSNDTNVAVDRGEIQKEMDELAKEVTRISNSTEFNTQKLINGAINDTTGIKSTKFHIGANANQDITLSINAMDAKSLGVSRDVNSATIDPTNTAKISGVKVDSVDVKKTLATGDYTVKAEVGAAGATSSTTTSTSGTIGTTAVTGTATADTNVVLSYTVGSGTAAVTKGTTADQVSTTGAVTGTATADTSVTLTYDAGVGANDVTASAGVTTTGAVTGAADKSTSVTLTRTAGTNTTATSVKTGDVTIGAGSTAGTASAETNLVLTRTAVSPAIEATQTADAVLGNSVAFDTATKINVGGTDVTLTNVKALGAAYAADTNIDTVVTALQADIDAVTTLSGAYTVGKSGTNLTLTSTATGLAAEINLSASDVGTGATLLGFTTLTAVNGADAVSKWVGTGTAMGTTGAGNHADNSSFVVNDITVDTSKLTGATDGDTVTIAALTSTWQASGDLTGTVSDATNAINGLNIDATKLTGSTIGDTVTVAATVAPTWTASGGGVGFDGVKTGATNAINGLNIDITKLTGAADGDVVKVDAKLTSGWTATGDITGAILGATNAVNGMNIDVTQLSGFTNNQVVSISGTKDASTTVQLFKNAATAATAVLTETSTTGTDTGAVTGTASADTSVTLTRTAGTAATAGAATVGSSAAAATVTTGGTLNLKIDGTVVDVTIGTGDTREAVVTAINAAADGVFGTSGGAYASLATGGILTIESLTTGATSKTEVVGVSAGTALTDLNLTVGAGAAGSDAIASTWVASGADAVTAGIDGTISGATNAINGMNIDVDKLTGFADGETVTVTGTAASATPAAIGSKVNINQVNGGAYTVGDTTTGQAKVTFKAGQAAVGSSTITVATSDASEAVKQSDDTMSEATVSGGINVSTQASASSAITTIQSALEMVSAERSKLGAYQNRLEHTIANLGTSSENLTSAESRIRDVDMAKEMSTFSKNNILSQAAQAMLSQANQQPQQVLQLLR